MAGAAGAEVCTAAVEAVAVVAVVAAVAAVDTKWMAVVVHLDLDLLEVVVVAVRMGVEPGTVREVGQHYTEADERAAVRRVRPYLCFHCVEEGRIACKVAVIEVLVAPAEGDTAQPTNPA